MNPKCETCGKLATVMVRDFGITGMETLAGMEDVAFQEFRPGTIHWFCDKHRRDPKVEKDYLTEEQ